MPRLGIKKYIFMLGADKIISNWRLPIFKLFYDFIILKSKQ